MPYSPNVICLERYHVCDVVITARTKEDLSIQASIACQELWDERDMDEGTGWRRREAVPDLAMARSGSRFHCFGGGARGDHVKLAMMVGKAPPPSSEQAQNGRGRPLPADFLF